MASFPRPFRESGAPLGPLRRPITPIHPPAPPTRAAPPTGAPAYNPGAPPAAPAPEGAGPPNLQQQASALVSQQIDPILRQIVANSNARAAGLGSAISGLTRGFAGSQEHYRGDQKSMVAPSRSIIKGTATGLRTELTGLGASQGQAQDQMLAQAGQAPGAGGADINLQDIGKNAGGTAYAIGAAAIQQLQTEQAAAESYASQLPGFAQLAGGQAAGDVQRQLASALAADLGNATSQAPGLYYSIYQDLLGQQTAASDKAYNREQDRLAQARSDAETAYQHGIDARNWAYQQRKDKAGIVAPNAPTLAGRNAYWQGLAAARTKDTGDQWVATNTGIRPADANPSRPGIQRVRTVSGQGADYLNQGRQVSAAATATRAQTGQTNAQTAQTRARIAQQQANTAAQREADRHAEAVRRINIASKNAQTSAQRAAIADRRAREIARNNRARNGIAIRKAAAAKKKAPAGSSSGLVPSGP